MAKRVLVADDSSFMRNRIKEALDGGDVSVVGEAKDADEAAALFRKLKPDLVTLDITMRNTDGFAAAEQILQEDPTTKIVLLTLRRKEEKHFLDEAALKMGIKAVILKPFRPEELKKHIVRILEG